MADKPKPVARVPSGMTRPDELYVQGDRLPVPDVEEKNTDSVWALWSDLVEDKPEAPAPESDKDGRDRDFLETVPLDINRHAETQLMDLPDLPKKPDK
ncbi:MAG: hypothetical protein ABJA49_04920 [Betaproteobacteria bacterium]